MRPRGREGTAQGPRERRPGARRAREEIDLLKSHSRHSACEGPFQKSDNYTHPGLERR